MRIIGHEDDALNEYLNSLKDEDEKVSPFDADTLADMKYDAMQDDKIDNRQINVNHGR